MQWILLVLIGVLFGLGVDDRRDLTKKGAIALILLVLYFWGNQHP